MVNKKFLLHLLAAIMVSSMVFCTTPPKKEDKPGEKTVEDKTKEEKPKEVKERAKEGDDGKESTTDSKIDDGKESVVDNKDGKESTTDDGRESRIDDGKESTTDEGKESTTDEGKESTTDEGKEDSSKDVQKIVGDLNSKLEKLRFPDGKKLDGFEYKKTDIPNAGNFSAWLGMNKTTFKKIFALPKNYKLEITGHTDAIGPEDATDGKKGNIYYSEQRANTVKKAFVKAGYSASKIVTKGVGSQNLISGVDKRSSKHRRVTFRIINTDSGE